MRRRKSTRSVGGKQSTGHLERLVIGRQAVQLILEHNPSNVHQLSIEKGLSEHSGDIQKIEEVAEANGVSLHYCSHDWLETLVGNSNHQGVAVELHKRKFYSSKELLEQAGDSPVLLIALDELFDPQNVGSVLRAAECFGADGVVWSRNRGAGITPAVTKVSAGASELVPLIPVSNLRTELLRLRKLGFHIVVADGSPEAQQIDSYDFPEKLVIVLGSEGKGVQPLIKREADDTVSIPMVGVIDSLNVAQAAAVFLAFWQRAGQSN